MSEKPSVSSQADRCLMLLVRHGATANNDAHPPRLQGCRSDAELSAAGRRQALQTARHLQRLSFSAAYASPLRRARQTAEILAAPRGLAVTTVAELTECDVGRWEGRTWSEIEREDPEHFAAFIADSAANPYAGGESLDDVRARILPAFEQLLQRHLGQTVLVVGHNVVNRVYLADRLGWPIAKARSIPQSNCGVNLIEYCQAKATVLTINAALHLVN